MKGISEGSKVPYEHVLSINLRCEILHTLGKHSDCVMINDDDIEKLLECSDFFIATESDV